MNLEPPRYACEGLLWLILFFAPAAFGSTEWWSRAVLESLIFILAAMCALRRDFLSPLNIPLFGFIVIIGLGATQLLHQRPMAVPAGPLPFTLSRPQTLYALLHWSALAALLWSVSGILRWEGALQRFSWAIFLSGVFIAVVGILQRGQGNTAYYGLRQIRRGNPFGPFTNYDHAASWMVAATFVGVGIFAENFRRARVSLTERVPKQILIGFLLAVQLAAIGGTKSRGAAIALFAAAFVTGYFVVGALDSAFARRLCRVGLILGCSCYVAFLYFNPKWFFFADRALDYSATRRVSMYRSGIHMLADNPLFGVGLGNFKNAFYPYQNPAILEVVDHIHSSWLEVALETGLFGIFVFGVSVLWPLARLGRALMLAAVQSREAAAAYFAAFLSFILHGFIEFTFQIPANAVLFVALAGAITVISFPLAGKSLNGERRQRVLAGVLLTLAVLSIPVGFDGVKPRLGRPVMLEQNAFLPAGDKK